MRATVKILFILISGFINSQETVKIVSKYFVKNGEVLFRIVPVNYESFERINSSALQIIRREKRNDMFGHDTVLIKKQKCYDANDLRSWAKLMKKDKKKGAFVYQAVFNNRPQSKTHSQKEQQYSKGIYDMLLLSCNFDSDIAKACGLYFQDSTISNKSRYEYRIYHIAVTGEKKMIETITVDASILSENILMTDLKGKQKTNVANLKWNALKYKKEYGGYNIERSEDSINYKRINFSPAILLTSQFEKDKEYLFYSDTMFKLRQKYFYRIRGINFFGEESSPSNVITIYNAESLSSAPVLDSVNVAGNNKIRVKWRMTNKDDPERVKEYILTESTKDAGPYTIIYKGTNTEYVDSVPQVTNYYKAGAITFGGDTVFSYSKYAVIVDTLPPHIPTGLEASVTREGLVSIRWKNNRDKNCLGYKLFRSNSPNEEFIQVNNNFIKDTFYNEKLNLKTLSRNVYFCVSATDQNFNTSERSVIIAVRRPDTIPPSSPILKRLSCNSEGIEINFVLSHSDDVAFHSIMKKAAKDSLYQKVIVFSSYSTEQFVDTNTAHGETYFYKIAATDSTGNITFSDPLTIKNETGYRKKITHVGYNVDRNLKCIHLNWRYAESAIEKFILYRRKENEVFSILKTIEGSAFNYKDSNVQIGNTYEYRVKAIMYSGAESIISDKIKVVY